MTTTIEVRTAEVTDGRGGRGKDGGGGRGDGGGGDRVKGPRMPPIHPPLGGILGPFKNPVF